MKLDLTSYQKALSQLESYYRLSCSQPADKDPLVLAAFRSAVIQAFEYSYELSIKMLQRQLSEMESAAGLIDSLPYKDLIRTGAEKGLIENPNLWFDFRKLRNVTAHTYDETKAREVYGSIPSFLEQTARFYARLKKHN